MQRPSGDNAKPTVPRNRAEEVAKFILKQLTPQGRGFSDNLVEEVNSELDAIDSDAADAVRDIITQHHLKTLDSVNTVNRLAPEQREPRIIAYFMIMNYTAILLDSGHYHRQRGVLNATGEHLLQIWHIFANKLIDRRVATHQQMDKEEASLMEAIRKAGRSQSFSILGAFKTAFKRKS